MFGGQRKNFNCGHHITAPGLLYEVSQGEDVGGGYEGREEKCRWAVWWGGSQWHLHRGSRIKKKD